MEARSVCLPYADNRIISLIIFSHIRSLSLGVSGGYCGWGSLATALDSDDGTCLMRRFGPLILSHRSDFSTKTTDIVRCKIRAYIDSGLVCMLMLVKRIARLLYKFLFLVPVHSSSSLTS